MAEANYRLPAPLNVHDGNIGVSFKCWKRQLEVYMTASGVSEKSNKTQSAVILQCAGYDIIYASEHFVWTKADGTAMSDDEKNDPENVMKKIEEYCIPRQSEVLLSYRFWNVQWRSPFDSFLTEL